MIPQTPSTHESSRDQGLSNQLSVQGGQPILHTVQVVQHTDVPDDFEQQMQSLYPDLDLQRYASDSESEVESHSSVSSGSENESAEVESSDEEFIRGDEELPTFEEIQQLREVYAKARQDNVFEQLMTWVKERCGSSRGMLSVKEVKEACNNLRKNEAEKVNGSKLRSAPIEVQSATSIYAESQKSGMLNELAAHGDQHMRIHKRLLTHDEVREMFNDLEKRKSKMQETLALSKEEERLEKVEFEVDEVEHNLGAIQSLSEDEQLENVDVKAEKKAFDDELRARTEQSGINARMQVSIEEEDIYEAPEDKKLDREKAQKPYIDLRLQSSSRSRSSGREQLSTTDDVYLSDVEEENSGNSGLSEEPGNTIGVGDAIEAVASGIFRCIGLKKCLGWFKQRSDSSETDVTLTITEDPMVGDSGMFSALDENAPLLSSLFDKVEPIPIGLKKSSYIKEDQEDIVFQKGPKYYQPRFDRPQAESKTRGAKEKAKPNPTNERRVLEEVIYEPPYNRNEPLYREATALRLGRSQVVPV